MRQRAIRGHQQEQRGGHWWGRGAYKEGALVMDRGFQFFPFFRWMGLLLMTLSLDQLPQSSSFCSFTNLWYVFTHLVLKRISDTACRSPSPILIQVLEASLFWTTAIFITLKKSVHLLKMKLVCTYCIEATPIPCSMFSLGCKLIFLPPYSPDLNPIEQVFSAIKSYLQ